MGVAVSREGTNTLSRSEWPLIVVPGLLASRIKRTKTEGTSSKDKIWDPDHTTFTLGLMTESIDDLARRFTPGQTVGEPCQIPHYSRLRKPELIARGWGGPSWDFYGRGVEELQKWLRSEGGVVYCFGYDWRDSNLATGALLSQLIERIKNERVNGALRFRQKPILVTHSNGGLVARAACVNGSESEVSAVVHTFMPTYGTPEAYTKFKLGESTMLGKIIGKTHEEISVIAAGVKVLGQLLPNQIYPRGSKPWLTWDAALEPDLDPRQKYSLSDPYPIYLEKSGRIGLVSHRAMEADVVLIRNAVWAHHTRARLKLLIENVNEARKYHAQVVRDYTHPYTYLITGTGVDTAVSAHQRHHVETVYGVKLPSVGVTERTEGPGDETVAELAGRVFESYPNCQKHVLLSGIKHAAAFNNGLVITGMLNYIRHARSTIPPEKQHWQ